MRLRTRLMFAACCFAPIASQATVVWSTCQTITAVDNYLAGTPAQLILVLSPGIAGCSVITAGAMSFEVGEQGITASNINYFLATSLTAFTAGKRVMIAYDNSTASCFGSTLAVGGFSAQCP